MQLCGSSYVISILTHQCISLSLIPPVTQKENLHLMAGWHHQLNEHEFEQIPGDSKGQGSLACTWVRKESDMLNSNLHV